MACSLLGGRIGHDPTAWVIVGAGYLLSALALNGVFLLVHEGTHHLISARSGVNRAISVLLGIPLFMSFTAYKVTHIRHHQFLGDARDPDDYRNYTESKAVLWLLHFTRLLCASYLYLLSVPLVAMRHSLPAAKRQIIQEYLFLAAVYVALFSLIPFHWLLHAWLIPTVFVNFLINVRGLTQHSVTDVDDQFVASRSIQSHRIVAFLYMNENYHLEHHLYPNVPFYNLRELHTILAERWPRALTVPSYSWFLMRFFKATLTLDDTPIGIITKRQPSAVDRTVPPE